MESKGKDKKTPPNKSRNDSPKPKQANRSSSSAPSQSGRDRYPKGAVSQELIDNRRSQFDPFKDCRDCWGNGRAEYRHDWRSCEYTKAQRERMADRQKPKKEEDKDKGRK